MLTNNVAVADLAEHFGRFVSALANHGIGASLGFASTNPGVVTVADAFAQADTDMYAAKLAHRTG